MSMFILGVVKVSSSQSGSSAVGAFSTAQVGAPANEEECYDKGAKVYVLFATEHDINGAEILPQPDMAIHREILHYDDAAVDALWQDAADYFASALGVPDLTEWEIPDSATGIRYSPDGDWSAAPVSFNNEIKTMYMSNPDGSNQITPDCPAPFEVEQVRLERMTPGLVMPNTPMQVAPGDTWGYGHILFDTTKEGGWESVQFVNVVPIHVDELLSGFFTNLQLSHPVWGQGQCLSASTLTPTPTGGIHQSLRATMSFPARWEYGVV